MGDGASQDAAAAVGTADNPILSIHQYTAVNDL